ncbi:MAG: hypothetical protein FD123_2979 [Bacteroidetes bacterium]|nr:MAG: hypothetical protein FD123_2979 [Bacteroidota bacterium]
MDNVQILAIAGSVIFLGIIAWLILRGKLREEYAIIWIICSAVLIVLSFWRKGLDYFAKLLGIYDPPNLLFIGAVFAILIYLLHLSIVVSKLQEQNKILAQQIALLRAEESRKAKENK